MTPTVASADLLRLLAGFAEAPGADHQAWAQTLGLAAPASHGTWQTAYTETFDHQCPPYASIYLGERGAIGGEAAERVADFRRLLGARPDGPPDALAALLADYAALVEHAENDARAAHARRALLWEHLLCWLLPYLDSVARSAAAPYGEWAKLARAVLQAEAGLFAAPERLPLHLRAAPKADRQPGENGLDNIISALLTPMRSGMFLTPRDLGRMAGALGVEAGFGSRPFILRRLLQANAQGSLSQLACEAKRQASAHAEDRDTLGPIADFWLQRASHTATTLAEMAQHAHARPGKESAVQAEL